MHAYIATTSSLDIADKFVDELADKLRWIAASGTTGVARDGLRPALRMLLFKKRAIYFRVRDEQCRIIRVLHTRQDIESQSFDEDGTDP